MMQHVEYVYYAVYLSIGNKGISDAAEHLLVL